MLVLKNFRPWKDFHTDPYINYTQHSQNWDYLRYNIIYSFSLFYGLFLGLGLLLRVFCFLCFTSAVRNKLYYTRDEPKIVLSSRWRDGLSSRRDGLSSSRDGLSSRRDGLSIRRDGLSSRQLADT